MNASLSHSVTLTVDQLSDALLHFLCRKEDDGMDFFPLRITAASIQLDPNQTLNLKVSKEPLSERIPAMKRQLQYEKARYTFTREEIFHALSRFLCHFIWRKQYDGNYIESLSIDLPGSVCIETEFMPRGSNQEDGKPQFDGSL